MTSNTALPHSQSNSHVSTFQSVFEGASQQSSPAPASAKDSAKPPAVQTPLNRAMSDPSSTPNASGSGTEGSVRAAAPAQGERSLVSQSDSHGETMISTALSGGVQSLPVSQLPINPYGSMLPMAVAVNSVEGVTAAAAIPPATNTPTGANAPNRAASKEEKPKGTVAHDSVGTLNMMAIPVVDQPHIPVQPVWNGQGHWREQGSGSTGSSAKPAMPNAPNEAHSVSTGAVAGTTTVDANTKGLPQGVQPSDATLLAQGLGEAAKAVADIPAVSSSPGKVDGSLPIGKAMQKGAFDAISSGSSDPNPQLDVSKSSTGGTADATLHSAQSAGQGSQSSQLDPLKMAIGAVRGPESASVQLQAQAVTMHVASHATATAQNAQSSLGDSVGTAKLPGVPGQVRTAGDEPVAASGINAAKLIQSMGGSEMRVGMHSTEFGDIAIRTTISQQQMVTQISLSHNDLSQAISAHVATVQAKLGQDYGLHASIEVNNQGSSLSGDAQHASPQEQRAFGGSKRAQSAAAPPEIDSGIGMGAIPSVGNRYGLDIRV